MTAQAAHAIVEAENKAEDIMRRIDVKEVEFTGAGRYLLARKSIRKSSLARERRQTIS